MLIRAPKACLLGGLTLKKRVQWYTRVVLWMMKKMKMIITTSPHQHTRLDRVIADSLGAVVTLKVKSAQHPKSRENLWAISFFWVEADLQKLTQVDRQGCASAIYIHMYDNHNHHDHTTLRWYEKNFSSESICLCVWRRWW